MTTKPIPHGTLNGYKNRGCRCPECTAANTKYHREYNWRTGKAIPRDAWKELNEATKKHGTLSRYRHGCHCDQCRAAAAAQKRRQRANNAEHYRQIWRDNYHRRKAKAVSSDA